MQHQIKLWCNKCNREISQNENSYCMLCLYDKDEELHDQDLQTRGVAGPGGDESRIHRSTGDVGSLQASGQLEGEEVERELAVGIALHAGERPLLLEIVKVDFTVLVC